MTNSSEKGDRTERELVNELDEREFAVMRAPASGAATKRELPDVLAGNGVLFLAIEAKASGKDKVYIDGEEVEDLQYFAEQFGADAWIGVRFDRRDWYFFRPEDCYVTDGGNYRIKEETALQEGADLDELTGHSEQQRLG